MRKYLVKRTTHLFGPAENYKDAIKKAKNGCFGEVRSWYVAKEQK